MCCSCLFGFDTAPQFHSGRDSCADGCRRRLHCAQLHGAPSLRFVGATVCFLCDTRVHCSPNRVARHRVSRVVYALMATGRYRGHEQPRTARCVFSKSTFRKTTRSYVLSLWQEAAVVETELFPRAALEFYTATTHHRRVARAERERERSLVATRSLASRKRGHPSRRRRRRPRRRRASEGVRLAFQKFRDPRDVIRFFRRGTWATRNVQRQAAICNSVGV